MDDGSNADDGDGDDDNDDDGKSTNESHQCAARVSVDVFFSFASNIPFWSGAGTN